MMDKNIAPGPKGSFFLGNLPEFSKDINQFLLGLSRDYPDIARFRLGPHECYLVSDPDYIKSVLVSNNKSYIKDDLFWKHTKPLIGNSLLTSSGETWRKQRKLSAPAFQHKTMHNYVEYMQSFSKEWIEKCNATENFDMQQAMGDLTAKIVVKSLFGSDTDAIGEKISKAVKDTTDVVINRLKQAITLPFFIPTPDNRRYMNGVRELDKLVFGFIQEHRNGTASEDTLLSALMNATNEDGSHLTDQQLRNETITLFLAGHETTALSLTWAWYLLSQHPEVERKLHAEIDTVLQGRTPGLDDFSNLPYTRAVIKEAIRLYPPAYTFSREAIEDTTIGDFHIKKGSAIFISPWALHRNEAYFSNPEDFIPERWTAELEKTLPRYAWVPFGGGPRVCIGEGFAMAESMIILATAAQQLTFRYNASSAPIPYPSVTLGPLNGMPVTAKKRSAQSIEKQRLKATEAG